MATDTSLEILRRFLDNPQPTLDEAVEAFTPLTIGEYDDIHIAALLATIRTRGETFADIAGAARAFLAAGRPFPITGEGIMDTAGTGGDGANVPVRPCLQPGDCARAASTQVPRRTDVVQHNGSIALPGAPGVPDHGDCQPVDWAAHH